METLFFSVQTQKMFRLPPAVLHENFVWFLSRFQDARHRVDAIWLTTDCMHAVSIRGERETWCKMIKIQETQRYCIPSLQLRINYSMHQISGAMGTYRPRSGRHSDCSGPIRLFISSNWNEPCSLRSLEQR